MEIIGFVVIVLVMVIVIIRRQYKKNQLKDKENLETAANQIQLQIEEVADAVIDRMENRINHLEMLIEEADTKINELDDKLQYYQQRDEEKAFIASVRADKRISAEKSAAVEMQKSVNRTGDSAPVKKFLKPNLSSTNKKVLALLESGYTLDDIAKKTGMGKGAILLIKEMYKN